MWGQSKGFPLLLLAERLDCCWGLKCQGSKTSPYTTWKYRWIKTPRGQPLPKEINILCDPMDYSLPGSSVHEILQARLLEWVAIPFSRNIPNPGIKPGLPHCRQILYQLSHQGSPREIKKIIYIQPFPPQSRLSWDTEFVQPLSKRLHWNSMIGWYWYQAEVSLVLHLHFAFLPDLNLLNPHFSSPGLSLLMKQ